MNGATDAELHDRLAIRALVENWAVSRDAGDWDRFATCWHEDGYMCATWCQAPWRDFIAASVAGWEKGVSILHFLGGHSAELAGRRAIAQTKMTISQRAAVHGVMVDVVCTGRFYDFLEKRDGDDGAAGPRSGPAAPHGRARWGVVLRQPIYEKDRMDPVDPAARLALDPALLARFPEGYRHLAYLQTQIGYAVKTDMPGLKGPEVEALYARGARWLAGGAPG
ncbi:nuclear transport factor 2 family protein [Dankookia rubra]|uniref:Nuclear transport factor 2 family protein n=1 Tax=Dankookia rubra TaxID=1442381 RepID=A0A4R5QJF9_9PROT|nr:nuclear transport factor 2 family protein [Dankookia rubra]TDH62978.1 nuclear transport factor 2 family protein [Dankookia rubra]